MDGQVFEGVGEGKGCEFCWMGGRPMCDADDSLSKQDWHILRRRHTFALLATLYESTNDPGLRKLILQVSLECADVVGCPSKESFVSLSRRFQALSTSQSQPVISWTAKVYYPGLLYRYERFERTMTS